MRARNVCFGMLVAGLLAACVNEPPIRITAPPPPPPVAMPVLSVSAPPEPIKPPLDLTVVADIETRLNKFAPIVLDFDEAKVAPEDRAVLKKVIEASKIMQEIFIRQLDADGPDFHASLATDATKAYAAMYFDIMGSRWDELDHEVPFVGSQKRAPGANFYPADMTREEFEKFVAANPDKAEAFKSYFSVIARKDGKLTAVPYSEAYKEHLETASSLLREAAAAAKEPTLKKFLELRAAAFLSNDYIESDKAWMDVKGSLEVTIGPYETYMDQLFQYKATYEAFIGLRDQEESKRLEVIGQKMAELEKNLPLADKYKKDAEARAKGSPIDVVHLLCNAGISGVQTVAYNLPNDERVRKDKGSKKVMLKNVLQGKFEHMVKPIAAKVLAEDQLKLLNADAVFAYILQHEVAHGLGPGIITLKDGSKSEVNKELKELYGGIEEAKADITGLVNAAYLIDKGIYPKKYEKEIYVAFLATAFRQMRFGIKEAHGKGVVSSVNYLMQKGAITFDPKTSRFKINFAKIKKAVRELSHEYLTLEAEGNYDGAKAFFEKYAVISPELQKAVDAIGTEIPIDITPQFTVYKKMESW